MEWRWKQIEVHICDSIHRLSVVVIVYYDMVKNININVSDKALLLNIIIHGISTNTINQCYYFMLESKSILTASTATSESKEFIYN